MALKQLTAGGQNCERTAVNEYVWVFVTKAKDNLNDSWKLPRHLSVAGICLFFNQFEF